MADYKIKLEVFEGPLALLMHLIEKNKLEIYDIPIAEITEQYLAYLKAMENFNIDIASDFLVMAATLLLIKSRMLLPKPQKQEIEEEDFDPRQELVNRLIEYRKFRQMAAVFEDMRSDRECLYTREQQIFPEQFTLPEGLKLDQLIKAFAAVWESSTDDFALVCREEISVQDKMLDIINILRKTGGKIEFRQTIFRTHSKTEVVASFLALLELIRLKRINIEQEECFAPIYLVLRKDEI